MRTIRLPEDVSLFPTLQVGEAVLLSGTVFTARDAAHKRGIPFDLNNQTVYYAGPCPTPEGAVVGSMGPTTSSRMDAFTPALLDGGLKGMIGKGARSKEVVDAIQRNGAVYFAAVGGAGALYASCVKAVEVVAYPDLLCEAVRKITVENFPVLVAITPNGSVYD